MVPSFPGRIRSVTDNMEKSKAKKSKEKNKEEKKIEKKGEERKPKISDLDFKNLRSCLQQVLKKMDGLMLPLIKNCRNDKGGRITN